MSKEPNDNGKPTCCGPGDLSACVIETTEARNKTDLKTKPPKKNSETDDSKNGGKNSAPWVFGFDPEKIILEEGDAKSEQ